MTRWLLALLLAVLACGQDGQNPAKQGSDKPSEEVSDALRVEKDEGPIKATLSLVPGEPRLGDVLTLTLRVEHGPNVRAELPPFGEALGRFTVLKFVPRREARPDGGSIETQVYSLQTPGSGKQRIPSLRVEYRVEGEKELRELLTDELPVEIASVVQGAEVSRELSPPPDKLDASPGWPWWIWPAAGVASIPILIALVLLMRKRKQRAIRRQQLGAYDAAMRRLRALQTKPLPEGDDADAWYVELSGIVRRYIEDRLQIRAPELTTEEFLTSASGHSHLEAEVRTGLTEFLAACDQVKFAAYQPSSDESQTTLALAEQLLGGQEQHLRKLESDARAREEAAR
jgi:hypothetical protein